MASLIIIVITITCVRGRVLSLIYILSESLSVSTVVEEFAAPREVEEEEGTGKLLIVKGALSSAEWCEGHAHTTQSITV